MPGNYLLDTNIVIPLLRFDQTVLDRVAQVDSIWPCSIVLGELYNGAFKSARVTENLAHLDHYVALNVVLPCDARTAREYGRIKHALLAKGRPIPENDIWIAAIAIQHGLTLATRDSDFAHIDGLTFEVW